MSTHVLTVVPVTKVGTVDIVATMGTDGELGNVATDLYIPNDGKTTLIIDAVGGDTWTFTPKLDKYGRTESRIVTIAAGKWGIMGPWLPELWNDPNGYIHFAPTVGKAADLLLAVRVANPS